VLLKPGEGMETVVTRPAARQHRQGLKALDLRSLPREEGPPSELQIRREKFAYFEKRCSEVLSKTGKFCWGDVYLCLLSTFLLRERKCEGSALSTKTSPLLPFFGIQ